MRTIKIMPDYHCYPLWEIFTDGIDNLDHYTLPISSDLKTELDRWADKYDATLNQEDPRESNFASTSKEKEFWNQGHYLFEKLDTQLKDSGFTIISSLKD
jgi:hypothetical protein